MNPITFDLTIDPYPELPDHYLWQRLLPSAYILDGGFARNGLLGLLHGMRCLGAILERDGEEVWLSAGAMEPIEYARYRRDWLRPKKDKINLLLTELGERLTRLEAAAEQEQVALL